MAKVSAKSVTAPVSIQVARSMSAIENGNLQCIAVRVGMGTVSR